MKGFSIHIDPINIKAESFISKNYDDFHLQTDQFEFLFEGVLINKQKLLKEFALKDYHTLILELYFQKKQEIIKLFEGEFSGYIYDKNKKKLFVFTNISATQRVFYGKFENQIFIDTSLSRLNENLKRNAIISQPDEESLYQLLCFCNLPESKTPLQDVKKLFDGHYVEIDCNTLVVEEKSYFDLSATNLFSKNKENAVDQIHEKFEESVCLEYEKDAEFGKNHLALLSGGLDSRVAMMYAMKNKFDIGNALCFSHSNYYDHTISEKIANDYGIHYEFKPLDGGDFLKKIDELTEISEGLTIFTGGIHVQYAMENLNYKNFSLFHSGSIGDGVLGGFNSEPRRKKPTSYKIVVNETFLPKIKTSLDQILKNYETEELFLLRNIAYNRTVLGAKVHEKIAYQTSPFMTKDFLKLAISLPEEWKFGHKIYIEWINKHCREATKYTWERTLMKPNAAWKTYFGDKVLKRSFNLLNNKILRTPEAASMYPYEYYYKTNVMLQDVYQKYFDENIARLEGYPELQKDVIQLFSKSNFHNKCQAVNILSIFKLYFSK